MSRKNYLLSAALLFNVSLCSAVHLSDDYQGQVLIFPFYTVSNEQNSLITISNNTNEIKAVRVRFLEGENAYDALWFNLYMSPQDTWTGALQSTASTQPTVLGQPSVRLVSNDTTCSSTSFQNLEFTPVEFQQDDGSDEMNRTLNGHIEVFEMGVIDPESAIGQSIINEPGTDILCSGVQAAWSTGGIWETDPMTDVVDPSGGLSGGVLLVNVADGFSTQSSPIALENFYPAGSISHVSPESTDLNLSYSTRVSRVFSGGTFYQTEWPTGYEAVSAVLMHNSVGNDHVLSPSINAVTEWVLTFPSRRFYDNGAELTAPFSPPLREEVSYRCVELEAFDSADLVVWSRSGEQVLEDRGTVTLPPGPVDPQYLCSTTNVIGFSTDRDVMPTSVFAEDLAFSFYVNTTLEGRARLAFDEEKYATEAGIGASSQLNQKYYGLPVLGFSLTRFTNANAQPGLLAQYTALREHQMTRKIETIGN